MREVWITGAGIVTSLGSGLAAHEHAVRCGISGLVKRDFFNGRTPDRVCCGMVPDAAAGVSFERSAADRANLLLDLAFRQITETAGASRLGGADFFVGTTLGNMEGGTAYYKACRAGGAADPALVRGFLPCAPLSAVAAAHGVTGKRLTVSSACGSSAAAIGYAFNRIRCGLSDRIIAGGFDPLSTFVVGGFNSLRLIAPAQCRPFDKNRDGLNPGEGAALLLLEEAETARKRGAVPLGKIEGFGQALESYHHTRAHPEGRGLATAMERALLQAGVTADAVDHIHCHGTGTDADDLSEYMACRRVFGDKLAGKPACSTKSMTGHTFGAAAAINAGFSLISIRTGVVPGTLFYSEPDPEFAGLSVRAESVTLPAIRRVLTMALGFGGEAFALCIGTAE